MQMNSDIDQMTQKELLSAAWELEKKLRDGEITPAEASRLSLIKMALRRIQEAGAK